jgi:phage-related minor tail protein
MSEIETLGEMAAVLEQSLGGAVAETARLDGELKRMRETLAFTGREVGVLSTSIGGGLRRAFDGLVLDGARLSDVLAGLARSISASVYNVAMKPVQNAVGGLIAGGIGEFANALMPFARGASFAQGRVMPFAQGGVVAGPVSFPMRGGARGLMGEAGPEAIMPLARGADGRLGVRASGAGARPVTVVMNVSTPDVQGFQRGQTQIAAQLGRALARGQRNG